MPGKDFKPFNDDVLKILQDAIAVAQEYNHNFVNTAHIYLSLQSFLNVFKRKYEIDPENVDPRVAYVCDIYNKLKTILNKYEITGPKFRESFLKILTPGSEPVDGEKKKCEYNSDYEQVYKRLRKLSIECQRPSDIEDLIMVLFGDEAYVLFGLFSTITGSDQKCHDLYNEIAFAFKKAVVESYEDLDGIRELTNLNEWVKEHPRTVIGADKNIKKMLVPLRNRTIPNLVLTGPAGCGKSELVYELAQRINNGTLDDESGYFKDKVIYQLDPTALVAGSIFRGSLEEKLMNILDTVKEHKNVIIFIDELHTAMEAGGGSDGATNVGNMLKPYITRNEIQLIGATTNEEYRKYIAKDKAFASRFQQVLINEPTKEELKQILTGLIPIENEFFNKEVQEELIDRVVELSDRYSIDLGNPRKAIILLDAACAYSAIFRCKNKDVTVDDILEAIALQYDITASKTRTKDTYNALKERILSQDRVIKEVTQNLFGVEKNIRFPGRPLKSMVFAGPTGVGKTETAKIIAKYFCGSEKNLVKIPMSQYADEISARKITGAEPGLIGYDDEPELIKGLRQHPNSVVLFDEFEKAHIKVIKTLMDALDEGYLTDNKGDRVSFRNAIIIFTTNLGCNTDTGKAVGSGLIKHKELNNQDDIMKAIEKHFHDSPEVLTRINDIIIFDNLPEKTIDEIARRAAEEAQLEADVKYELTDEDYKEIKTKANITAYGARDVRDLAVKQITNKLLETSELAEIFQNTVKEDK